MHEAGMFQDDDRNLEKVFAASEMTRPWIKIQDEKILNLWFSGIQPKVIVIRLKLSSISVVYEALRRGRIAGVVPRRTKIHQDSPRAF